MSVSYPLINFILSNYGGFSVGTLCDSIDCEAYRHCVCVVIVTPPPLHVHTAGFFLSPDCVTDTSRQNAGRWPHLIPEVHGNGSSVCPFITALVFKLTRVRVCILQLFCLVNYLQYNMDESWIYTNSWASFLTGYLFMSFNQLINYYVALISFVAFVSFPVVWQALCTPFASEGQLLCLHPARA